MAGNRMAMTSGMTLPSLLMEAQQASRVPELIASRESALFIREDALKTLASPPGMRFFISWPNQVAAIPWGIASGVSVVSLMLNCLGAAKAGTARTTKSRRVMVERISLFMGSSLGKGFW